MGEQAVVCPICMHGILDSGDKWVCGQGDHCPQGFKVYKKTARYDLTVADLVDICNGALTQEHEFFSQAKNKTFKASLAWDSSERKVIFKFQNTRETVKGVLCPDHNVEFRASEKRYYCPTKLSEGVWCPVGAWRGFGGHELTGEELGQLLLGLVLGPWELRKKDGSGTYMATAEYDFEENKVKLTFVNGGTEDGQKPKAESAVVKTATSVTVATESESSEAPKWVTGLPQKAAQVTKLLGLNEEDAELICEAAIASVTGGRVKTATGIVTSEEANAVNKELNELAIGRKFPQAQFGDDGSECYVLVAAS